MHHNICMGSMTQTRASKRGSSQRVARAAIRITVTLSPESQRIVERFKGANGTSTSAAIDQIIQRSEPGPSRLKNVNGFLVLSDPPESAHGVMRATLDDIRRAEDAVDREYVEGILHRERRPAVRRKQSARL